MLPDTSRCYLQHSFSEEWSGHIHAGQLLLRSSCPCPCLPLHGAVQYEPELRQGQSEGHVVQVQARDVGRAVELECPEGEGQRGAAATAATAVSAAAVVKWLQACQVQGENGEKVVRPTDQTTNKLTTNQPTNQPVRCMRVR